MEETSELPQELLIEIFSRLPTKSVGKCRCLSKSWNSNLSTQQFIKQHLTRKPHQENLIFITPSHSLHTLTHPIQTDGLVSKKIELHDNWFGVGVVGSCNGLVLLVNKDIELLLINPITNQKVYIPDSDLALNKHKSYQMHGFGYDSCSDDYKIVMLSYYIKTNINTDSDSDNEYEPDCTDTFVDVYSVKTNVWKRVDSSTYVPSSANGVFVNGAIHWLASTRDSDHCVIDVIAVFDLSTEVFGEIPTPCTLDYFDYSILAVLGGHLWIVNHVYDYSSWTMWEYGLDETWMKLLIYSEKYQWHALKPLCYIGEDELVLVDAINLFVFDVSKGTYTDMIIDGLWVSVGDAGMFVDSLVAIG